MLMSMPYRQWTLKLIVDLYPQFTDLVILDTDGRLNTHRAFGELLLYTYYRSSYVPQAEQNYRDLVLAAASRIQTLDADHRQQLAPLLRRLGAAAIARGDKAMAAAIAKASLPPIPIAGGRAIRIIDHFEPGGWVGETFHHRPELPDFGLDEGHLDKAARRAYLKLEAIISRP